MFYIISFKGFSLIFFSEMATHIKSDMIVAFFFTVKTLLKMLSHKIYNSCGIISCIRKTLDINSKKLIY